MQKNDSNLRKKVATIAFELSKQQKGNGNGLPYDVWITTNTKVRKKCLREFKLMDTLGVGEMGTVYLACKGIDCNYAFKVRRINPITANKEEVNSFLKEVQFTKEASDLGVAPKLIDYWTCKSLNTDNGKYDTVGIILTEKWDMTLRDYIDDSSDPDTTIKEFMKNEPIVGERLRQYKKLLKKNHIKHGDIHENNIMLNVDEWDNAVDIAIIDYDRAERYNADVVWKLTNKLCKYRREGQKKTKKYKKLSKKVSLLNNVFSLHRSSEMDMLLNTHPNKLKEKCLETTDNTLICQDSDFLEIYIEKWHDKL